MDNRGNKGEDGSTFYGKLVAVHMTDNHPDGGVIRSTASATQGSEKYYPRHTVHFSLNHPVSAANGGTSNWTGRKYAVVTPLKSLVEANKGRLLGTKPVDTMFLDDVVLTEESKILCDELPENPIDGVKYQVVESPYNSVRDAIESSGRPFIPGGEHGWTDEGIMVGEGNQTDYLSREELYGNLKKASRSLGVELVGHQGPYQDFEIAVKFATNVEGFVREAASRGDYLEKESIMDGIRGKTHLLEELLREARGGSGPLLTEKMTKEAEAALEKLEEQKVEAPNILWKPREEMKKGPVGDFVVF